MDPLLTAASTALVQVMASEAWAGTRDRIARMYGRSEGIEAEAAQLDEVRAELLSGDQDQKLDAEAEWRAQLSRLLSENPRAAAELRHMVEEFAPRADAGPRTRNTVSGGTVDHVVQAEVINSLTLQAAPEEGDHVDFSDGTFNGSVVGVQHNHYGTQSPTAHVTTADWPRKDRLRRLDLGVHPTRRFDGESSVPPYVVRDCDGELSGLVRSALRNGGLVVVTGEPLSGKTRTAWAALHRNGRRDARVYVPQAGTDLRDLAAQLRGRDPEGMYIVWLDDLDGHLGEHGLTAGLLARLAAEKVLVLATMSDEAYETHRFGGGPASRLLRGVASVQLSCRWSEAELARLAEFDDPRLVDAARWHGERGVTEFLAVGPELWDEWRWAAHRNPLGHLLVRAAVDIARCGLEGDVPVSLLGEVCIMHDPEVDGVDNETFEAAMNWAFEPRHGVAGLLVPGSGDTVRAYGSLVADAMRFEGTEPVPDDVWEAVLTETLVDEKLDAEAVKAAARAAFLPRAEGGDADAMGALGAMAEHGGDTAEAEDWYRKSAELGDGEGARDAGRLLAARGAETEAMPYLETAAEAGFTDSMLTLAGIHQKRAAHWLRTAEAAGDVTAAARLSGPLVPPE
ncbi:sel1 repeat family protein [Streptomyces sp. NPDC086554]|uniref:sel1 repeat family protein n=1 Tax=Streptomyces sp. NPDC086554 TaxID=3154864 RepID=UPI0034323771